MAHTMYGLWKGARVCQGDNIKTDDQLGESFDPGIMAEAAPNVEFIRRGYECTSTKTCNMLLMKWSEQFARPLALCPKRSHGFPSKNSCRRVCMPRLFAMLFTGHATSLDLNLV